MRARMAEGGAGGAGGGGFGSTSQEGPRTQTLYVLEKQIGAMGKETETLKAVTAKIGITDGTYTEVLEGLNEGDLIVTSVATSDSAPIAMGPPGATPFGSPFGGGRRGR